MEDSRVRISVDALSQEIAEMNNCLEKRRDGAQACIKAVEAYCGETNLTGEAYSNSKDYFNTTHVPLLKQIVYLCDEIIDVNNSILPKFSQYVPDTRGFDADTSVLEEEIRRLKAENSNFIARIEDQRLSSRPTPLSNYNLGLQGWYDGQITINNYIIDELQKIVDGMRAFNIHCAGIYDEINILLDQLNAGIQQLNSQSVWNSEAKRFVISTEMLTKLAEIEYEKMIIHNPDGSIGLDREYVSRVLQQEAIQGSPAEIEATYLALIKTFETISSDDDLEYFLNACYIKREVAADVPDGTPNVVQSYDYFRRKAISNDGMHFEYSLSPVAIEMRNYYHSSGRISDALQALYGCEFMEDMVAERNLLQREALLEHMFEYREGPYARIGDQPFRLINIKTAGNLIIMNIGRFPNSHMIVQSPYSRGAANVTEGENVGIIHLRNKENADVGVVAAQLVADGLVGTITKGYPLIACGKYGVDFLVASYSYASEKADDNSVANSMEYTKALGAFGFDYQFYTVDNEFKMQYMSWDKQVFLRNYAAFKKGKGFLDLTIEELYSNPDTLKDFVDFGTTGVDNDGLNSVLYGDYYGDEQRMIEENVNATELAKLETIEGDDMYKGLGGEVDE